MCIRDRLYTGPAANAVGQLAPPPDVMTLPPAEAILEVAARDVPPAAPALVKTVRRFTTARAPAPSAPFYARALALAHRGVVTQLRRWPLIVAQFATCAVFASLIGMLYEGDGVPRIDQKGVENVNGYLFMLCTGTLFSSLFPPLQLFFRGLALARREAASGAYGLPLSVLAMQLADIVLQQALPCVFVSVTYRLIDPRHGLEGRGGQFGQAAHVAVGLEQGLERRPGEEQAFAAKGLEGFEDFHVGHVGREVVYGQEALDPVLGVGVFVGEGEREFEPGEGVPVLLLVVQNIDPGIDPFWQGVLVPPPRDLLGRFALRKHPPLHLLVLVAQLRVDHEHVHHAHDVRVVEVPHQLDLAQRAAREEAAVLGASAVGSKHQ